MTSVTIYSTPTCAYCKLAKEYFSSNNIDYTEVNIADDQAKIEEMIQKSGQMGVPVIDINGEIIVGFNKEKIDKLLKL